MYTVIGHPQSRTLRVIWALEEIGIPYELQQALPRSEEVLALNPLGKIPVLLHEETVMTDSVAILTYLADKHGMLTHEPGTHARAHQDAMTQFAVTELDGALWTKSKHSFVLPKEMRVEAIKATAAAEFARAMEQLGTLMGDKAFVAGDELTIPDIVISHCAGWARKAKFDLPDGKVGAYLARVHKRPAKTRVLEMIARTG